MPQRAANLFIPGGDLGIEQTVQLMDRLSSRASKDPAVIRWAQDAIRWTPARDVDAEARALYSWVKQNFRYTRDPVTAELVKDPVLLLGEHASTGRALGDCDDQATCLAAGLKAVGIPVEFVVVGQESPAAGLSGRDFSHILVRYLSPARGWTTLDTVTGTGPGWIPEGASRVGLMPAGAPHLVESNLAALRGNVGVRSRPSFGLVAGAAVVAVLWWRSRKRRR